MTKPPPISDREIAAGSVIVVPYPYSDRHTEKRRSAVVVADDRLARAGCLRLHGHRGKAWPQMHDVRTDDLQAAGLTIPCSVCPTEIARMEPSRIVRRAGRFTDEVAEAVFPMVLSFIAGRA